MESKYSSFKYNGEPITIIPGCYFSKNDLKNRLHLMGVECNNIQDKNALINLYESSLKDNKNKLKVISQLKKDTENLNVRKSMSLRQSMPSNINSFNNSQNKVANISCEVNPFNSREQLINIIKPMHTNKGQYAQNPFISTSITQNQSSNNNSINFSNISNINNYKNNSKNLYESKDNINNNKSNLTDTYNYNNNNSSFMSNQEMYFKQNENKDNSFNDNSKSRIINQQNENEINDNNVNNNNIRNSNNNIKNDIGITYNKQYEEKLNNYYNINDSKRLTYQENNYSKNNHINNEDNRKTYTNTANQLLYHNKDNNPLNASLNSNDKKYYNSHTNQDYENENVHNSNFNNNSMGLSSNLNYQKSNMDNLQNSSVENLNQIITPKENEEIVDISNNLQKRDQDEVSAFSFFSTSNLNNYSLYKNRKYICAHILILSLILLCTIVILRCIEDSWDSIIELPRRIIEAIHSFFTSLFFGAFKYWYFTISFIIICVIFFSYFKKMFFEKKCEKIFKKIRQDLIANNNYNDNMGITEDQIYQRYFKNEGISYRLFIKKYLPMLMKLKKKDPKIEIYSLIQDENINVVYWKILY